MSVADFKDWMQKTGTRAVDIASHLGISSNTVYRFIQGRRVHPLTARALIEYARDHQSGRKVAAGQ